ncbi:MAG: HAMP domain-containing sensor histidine kinase [Acidimicrobiales bacterium]
MRRQLTLAAVALTSMIVLAFLVPLGLLVPSVAEDRARNAAERLAETLVPVLATVDDPSQLRQVVDGVESAGVGRLSVVLPDGTVLGAPAGVDDNIALARRNRAFQAPVDGGVAVLVPVGTNGGTAVVQVVVSDDVLHQGVLSSWAVLAGLGLALVLVAAVVADRLSKTIVAPVMDLADTAERLGHGELDARVEPGGPPEIVEVGTILNRLADRISDLLTAEREEVADLSHRLRTPVTALRLDIDALAESEEKERLVADADALARAVDRLITEARRPVRVGVGTESDLTAITRERVEFWAALAEDQGRRWSLDLPDQPVLVAVHPDDLGAALDALLGNVLAHTPDGVAFAVAVRADGTTGSADGDASGRGSDGGSLVVEDEGPGLPTADVTERGTSHGGSTGLGLDIVKRTTEASGGGIELGTSASGGARITARFGPPAT